MSLFSEGTRETDEGAAYGEPLFHYLDRSGRPAVAAVRHKIDSMMENYPDGARAQLTGRLRSDDDIAHRGAMFELLLHEAFLGAGCHIESVEPRLAHTTRSPDFLVRTPQGERFYLEATLAHDESDRRRRANRLLDAAIEAVNGVRSDKYSLFVHHRGCPTAPVRLKALRDGIERWLNGLEAADFDGRYSNERYVYNQDGLCIEAQALTRKMPATSETRAIAAIMGPGSSKTVGATLKQAIESKVGRYGQLDLPYVVAVNGLEHAAEEHDVWGALIGPEVVRIPFDENGPRAKEAYFDRESDGVWVSPDRTPRRQGVSGVLVFNGLSVWSSPACRGIYVPHPIADKPLREFPLSVDRFDFDGNKYERKQGDRFGTFIGLPEDWLTGLDDGI